MTVFKHTPFAFLLGAVAGMLLSVVGFMSVCAFWDGGFSNRVLYLVALITMWPVLLAASLGITHDDMDNFPRLVLPCMVAWGLVAMSLHLAYAGIHRRWRRHV